MSKFLKIIFLSFGSLLFFSTSSYALCDFEKVTISTSLKSFQSRYVGDIDSRTNQLQSYNIPLKRICSNEFEQGIAQYSFINKKLQKITITDFEINSDYLRSLTYHYGKPTNGYNRPGTSGIAYHHWDKSGKSIFLIDSVIGDTRKQTIEIVSKRFNELSAKYFDYDNE